MKHRIVAISDLSEADISAWSDLARHAMEPNPFFEPGCLLPASKYLDNGQSMYLVIAEEGGRFYGCFPAAKLQGGIPPRFKFRLLSRPAVTTSVRRLPYDGTPLVRADRDVEVAKVLLLALKESATLGRSSFLVLQTMDADGPVASAIDQALVELRMPSHMLKSWTRPVVRRNTADTEFVNANRRKLAKLTNKLSRDLGKDVVVLDASCDKSMIELLVSMEVAGYKSNNDIAMATHNGESQWFEEMCDRFRDDDRLVLYALMVGGTAIAFQLMLRAGDCLFGLQSDYDENYARFSPGMILHRSFLEWFYSSSGVRMKDTCTFGGNSTLERLYPQTRRIETRLIMIGGVFDNLLLKAFSLAQKSISADSSMHGKFPKLQVILATVIRRLGLKPL